MALEKTEVVELYKSEHPILNRVLHEEGTEKIHSDIIYDRIIELEEDEETTLTQDEKDFAEEVLAANCYCIVE